MNKFLKIFLRLTGCLSGYSANSNRLYINSQTDSKIKMEKKLSTQNTIHRKYGYRIKSFLTHWMNIFYYFFAFFLLFFHWFL